MSPAAETGVRVARGLAATLTCGLAGGVAVGLVARLAMRIVALVDGRPTLFTVGGTLGILLGLTIFGLPFAGLFVLVRRHLPRGTIRKGLLFGAGLIVFPGLVFFFVVGGPELLEIGFPPLNFLMFAALFPLFGIVVSATAAWLEARLPPPARPIEEIL